jgi:hypothetical protein
MPFPIIPILAIAAIAGGGVSLGWYYNLSAKEKEEADIKATNLVLACGKIAADGLTKGQATAIIEQIEHHFT